ncbi:MAG: S41 family peptidase [Pseudomonadota bacterium]
MKTLLTQVAAPFFIAFVFGQPAVAGEANTSVKLAGLHGDPALISRELHGVWMSDGYGWALEIRDDGVRMLDVEQSGCIDAKDTLEEYETYFHSYELDASRNRLGLRGLFEGYTYYFARADALPPQCEVDLVSTPRSNFEFLRDVMTSHYAFFKVRGVNWQEIVEQAETQIRDDMSDDELWKVLQSMIAPIDDGHVSFSRVVDGRRVSFMPGRGRTQNSIIPLALERGDSPGRLFGQWFEEYKASILTDILGGNGKIIARDRVIYGMVDDEIGYLNVLKMGGYVEALGFTLEDFTTETDALNAALDEAFLNMESAKAIIVDMTYIGGGFDYLGREIAARFARKPVLGSHRGPAGIASIEPQPLYTYPTERVSFDGPVAVISSNLTMSASESFVMHMKAMPHVVHMGEPTRGALSEVLSKTLPNGWSVSISNEDYLDGELKSWEGIGVQPDIPMQVFDPMNIFNGHVAAIGQVADHLREQIKPTERPVS